MPTFPFIKTCGDVTFGSPSDGDVLTWDAGTSKYVNEAPATTSPGGSSGTLQYNNGGSFGGVTSSSVSGADVALGGVFTVGLLSVNPNSAIISDPPANVYAIFSLGMRLAAGKSLTSSSTSSAIGPADAYFYRSAASTWKIDSDGAGGAANLAVMGTGTFAGMVVGANGGGAIDAPSGVVQIYKPGYDSRIDIYDVNVVHTVQLVAQTGEGIFSGALSAASLNLGTLNTGTTPGTTTGQTVIDSISSHMMRWNGASWIDVSSPPGSIATYGGSTPPAGWLLCDGSAVSRSTYAALFAAIGTAFGSGNGTTTFNVPNFAGRFPAQTDGGTIGALGTTGGSQTSALSGMSGNADTNGDGTTTPVPVGSDISFPIIPPYLSVNFIIKT